MTIVKAMYLLILLTIINFLVGFLLLTSKDNTFLRLANDNTLIEYIVSSVKGETYNFSSLFKEHFSDSKNKELDVHFFFNHEIEKQPYFRKIFSDGVAELALYPYKLKQDLSYDYILKRTELASLNMEDWLQFPMENLTYYLPKKIHCDKYKIMLHENSMVFIIPFCSNVIVEKYE